MRMRLTKIDRVLSQCIVTDAISKNGGFVFVRQTSLTHLILGLRSVLLSKERSELYRKRFFSRALMWQKEQCLSQLPHLLPHFCLTNVISLNIVELK
jgi:hypothetical protein